MTINASGQVLLGGTTAGQSITYELGLTYNGYNNDPSGYLPAITSPINLNSADVRRLANRTTAGSSVGAGNIRGQGARVEFTLTTSGSNLIAQPTAGIAVATSSRLGATWALTYVNASTGANSFEFSLWSSSALSTSDWASKWKVIRVSDNQVMMAYTAAGAASVWYSQGTTTDPYYGSGWAQSVYFNTSVAAFAAGVAYAIVFN